MERLTTLLEKLKMDHLELQLDAVCEHAAQKELDYKSFLTQALEAEWNGPSIERYGVSGSSMGYIVDSGVRF